MLAPTFCNTSRSAARVCASPSRGFAIMLTMTCSARSCACATRLMCPLCRVPVVGTKATRAPASRHRRIRFRTEALRVRNSIVHGSAADAGPLAGSHGLSRARARPFAALRPERRSTAGQQAAPHRIEEMTATPRLADLREQLLVVAVVVDRVDGGGVNDPQRRGVVAMKEPRIGLGELVEIAALDVLLVAD